MKKVIAIILIIVFLIVIGGVIAFNIMSKKSENELAEAVITDVDLSKIPDGVYSGSSSIFPVKVQVEVNVQNNKIINIKIIKHDNGKGAKAEALTQEVIKAQSLNVDAISGATTSSKAILKAIENALKNGN